MIFRLKVKDSSGKSDQELIARFISSFKAEDLGELYARYMHLVYGVCLKYLKDRDAAMDGVMDIYEKLLREIPKQRIDNFKSWLHVVTKNYCLMQLRSEKSQEEKKAEWMNDNVIFMENEPVLHPVDEDAPEMDRLLMKCIEQLKDEQKQSVTLFYFGNKCYAEIAREMKTEEKKVKSLLQNAKRNLKICIDNNGGKR